MIYNIDRVRWVASFPSVFLLSSDMFVLDLEIEALTASCYLLVFFYVFDYLFTFLILMSLPKNNFSSSLVTE